MIPKKGVVSGTNTILLDTGLRIRCDSSGFGIGERVWVFRIHGTYTLEQVETVGDLKEKPQPKEDIPPYEDLDYDSWG